MREHLRRELQAERRVPTFQRPVQYAAISKGAIYFHMYDIFAKITFNKFLIFGFSLLLFFILRHFIFFRFIF